MADEEELWDELTNQAHDDLNLKKTLAIKEIMDGWLTQKGYPVIELTKSEPAKLTVTQRWFLLNTVNMTNTNMSSTHRW